MGNNGRILRFCFVIFRYFPFGGLQRSMKNIALACVRAGHGVTVYTTDWEGDPIAGVEVKQLVVPRKPTRKRDRRFSKLFLQSVDSSAFDLIVGFNKVPGLDIYYSGDTCFAVKAHEKHDWFYRMTPRCRAAIALERAVFAKGLKTRILIVAEGQRADYKKYFHTEDHRFYLIPPGIARDHIAPAAREPYGKKLREELKIDFPCRIVSMVASNLSLKGYARFLQAYLSLPDGLQSRTIMVLVGADPCIDEYRREITRLNLQTHVRFLGGREDVPEILFGSDLLVHPAHREATGNVLLEGAVAGLPVICSAVCGYSAYISRYSLGVVLPEPFEQKALNSALHGMLTDQLRMDAWKRSTRQFSTNDEIFSRPKRVVQIFETVSREKRTL
jgi:UDP-glucose:(heptosyl)LPS alpha-1,3-glucosyltransferase